MSNLDYESINGVAAQWAEIMWTVSWQFCVLGLAVLVVHWSLRRAAPNWRYWLWQILAIKLLLMPFWTAAAPWKWPNAVTDTGAITASQRIKDSVVIPKANIAAPVTKPLSSAV